MGKIFCVKVFSFTMRKDISYNELYRLRPSWFTAEKKLQLCFNFERSCFRQCAAFSASAVPGACERYSAR